jgi:hypothetical protein
MRVVLVEPDAGARRELVAELQQCGIAVAPFGDPRIAFLFLLGKLDEVDGVLVDDDDAELPAWLRCRLDILPVAPLVVTYSGRHPEREARITGEPRPIDSLAADEAPSMAEGHLAALLSSVAVAAGSAAAAAKG